MRFQSTNDEDVIQHFGEIMGWVQSNDQFSDAAKSSFAAGADGWVVAYAKAKSCSVVTHEVFAPEVKSRVPIPNVCSAFNVTYINTFEMLRALEIKFT